MTSAPVMTSTPAARAAMINGVFNGSATTSNTVRVGDRSFVEDSLASGGSRSTTPRGYGVAPRRAIATD